jgi:hypothetical protein
VVDEVVLNYLDILFIASFSIYYQNYKKANLSWWDYNPDSTVKLEE